jgi:hypothetical protein
MNGKERKLIVIMPTGIITMFVMICLSETSWGFCAELPCPPIPLALGIVSILGFLTFMFGVFYLLFGSEQENQTVNVPSGELGGDFQNE